MATLKLPRRKFLHLAAGAAALPAGSRVAMAQVYPSRPVRLIVGFPGGTTGDILIRLMGQWLSDRLGQPFIIENRPGAAGNVATEQVVRAAPDGYTLLLAVPANAINASLYDNLNFNFIDDIVPVAGVARSAFVMAVTPSVPAKTVPEFIAYAKANPGKVNMASFGTGTLSHVSGELFMMRAGVDMLHVPYRGSWMPDLLAGQVQVVFSAISIVIDNIRTGKQTARACSDQRNALGCTAGRPPIGRISAGLRGGCLVWALRAPEHTHGGGQQASRNDQPRSRRSQAEGATCRLSG